MWRHFRIVRHAIRRTLLSPLERGLFLLLVPVLLWLFVWLLVRATPGNDFLFQLQILRLQDYLLLGGLAVFSALLLVMQVYSIRQNRHSRGVSGAVGRGVVGSLPAFLATVLGTASCSACVASLFGFLGLGGVLFLLEYRWWLIAASVAVMGLAVYLTARKIEHACKSCRVSPHEGSLANSY